MQNAAALDISFQIQIAERLATFTARLLSFFVVFNGQGLRQLLL